STEPRSIGSWRTDRPSVSRARRRSSWAEPVPTTSTAYELSARCPTPCSTERSRSCLRRPSRSELPNDEVTQAARCDAGNDAANQPSAVEWLALVSVITLQFRDECG